MVPTTAHSVLPLHEGAAAATPPTGLGGSRPHFAPFRRSVIVLRLAASDISLQ